MTTIEWADVTWNPVTGCDRVSAGCDHCYALTMAKRLKAMGHPKYQTDGNPSTSGPGFGVQCHPDVLGEPLRWRKPRRVFVNSMSDLFHPDVPTEFILQVWSAMANAPDHTFQILTKRPQRMHRIVDAICWRGGVDGEPWEAYAWPYDDAETGEVVEDDLDGGGEMPLPNVWLGVSVESDKYTWRVNPLRDTPAAVRFVSAEPLLGPLPSLDLTGVDWLIVGGESGHGARPMHPDWVRDLRDRSVCTGGHDCSATNHVHGCYNDRCRSGIGEHRSTSFFFKQWGEWVPYEQDPLPPFWWSQHGDVIDGRHLPADLWDEAGRPVTRRDGHGTWIGDLDSGVVYRRVGKKAAGRLLDGVEWSEYPS